MTNANDARRAHKVLDGLSAGRILSRENEQLLRSFLPGLPKQKTLEEILEEVESAACSVTDSYWSPSLNPQDWLWELHAQLKGLKDAPAAVPALPAGMRLADYAEYGRCVVSPNDDENNLSCRIFYVDEVYVTDSYSRYVETSSLTFIDTEPAKPSHPEFLETEADYENAPEGTIVACEDSPPWHKFDSTWLSTITYGRNDAKRMSTVIRRVLRWGWGE